MPPTLETLEHLLHLLSLPSSLLPQRVRETPPSLLQLLLERIQGIRLPHLGSEVHTCKLVLGMLALELPDVDLGIVEPLKVVAGDDACLAVAVMALAVLAKRRGLWGHPEKEHVPQGLQEPMTPDVSLAFQQEALPKAGQYKRDDVEKVLRDEVQADGPTVLEEMVDHLGLEPVLASRTRVCLRWYHNADIDSKRLSIQILHNMLEKWRAKGSAQRSNRASMSAQNF